MSADLVAFLRLLLDADEQAARDASAGPWWAEDTSPRRWGEERDAEVASSQGRVALLDHDRNGDLNAEHVTRWDPARVLAEVEAKRRMLDLHDRVHHQCVAEDGPTQWHTSDPCATLRLLALPYASRPGYRPGWAPDA